MVLKSDKRRLGHLCVKSNGQIFCTVGLSLHIGSQTFDFGAGLHSMVRATSEKIKSKRGHRVKFFGFMAEMKMMGATEMGMKRKSDQEERKLSTSTTSTRKGNDNIVGRSNIHSLGNKTYNNKSWR